MANPIPLTIQSSNESLLSSQITIGTNSLELVYNQPNLYWILVIDRTDGSVKENFTFSSNDTVPSQLDPYKGNTQYILVLATQQLSSPNLPTGDLYKYLLSEGAGPELKQLEQIFAAFNCGTWGMMAYAYVAIMGDDSTSGFEASAVSDNAAFLVLQLIPVTVNGQTLYSPTSNL